MLSHLEHNPLCLAIASDYDENTDLIIFGDDGGYVNVINLNRKFLLENNSDTGPGEHYTPEKIRERNKNGDNIISMYRVCNFFNIRERFIMNGY